MEFMEKYGPGGEHAYLRDAWVSCLMWTLKDQERDFIGRFQKDTGNKYKAPTSPIDMLIDEQSGNQSDFVEAYVKWFDQNVWGNL